MFVNVIYDCTVANFHMIKQVNKLTFHIHVETHTIHQSCMYLLVLPFASVGASLPGCHTEFQVTAEKQYHSACCSYSIPIACLDPWCNKKALDHEDQQLRSSCCRSPPGNISLCGESLKNFLSDHSGTNLNTFIKVS